MNDLRFAFRQLLKNPGFTAVAVLALALGIGANTTIFSLLDAVLLKTLPVERPERLVVVAAAASDQPGMEIPFSYPVYREIRDQNAVFSGVCAHSGLPMSMSGAGRPERVLGELVSGNFFSVLGVAPHWGRLFTESDDQVPGAHSVAVLSFNAWQGRFGANPGIVGQIINLNGHPFTVVGVAAQGFRGLHVGVAPDVYVPLVMNYQVRPGGPPGAFENRENLWLAVIARLKADLSLEQAQAGADILYQSIREPDVRRNKGDTADDRFGRSIHLQLQPAKYGVASNLTRQFGQPLRVLMYLVGVVLLIACVNVANLLLARAAARQREIAVRLAMGAGRFRLIRQLLTEGYLLSALGGGLGLIFARWGIDALLSFLPQGRVPLALEIKPDLRVLGFTFGVTLLTGLLFGLVPALQATRPDLISSLKNQTAVFSVGNRRWEWRRLLVVLQVALSLVLVVGAGLFARSLQNLQAVDDGYHTDQVVTMALDPAQNGYKAESLGIFFDQLRQRVAALPGVKAVTYTYYLPMSGGFSRYGIEVPGYQASPGEDMAVLQNQIDPHFFAIFGIPVLAGRDFTTWDTPESPKVVIVNESLARRFFGDENPLGRRITLESYKDLEVVGVVADAKYRTLKEALPQTAYLPFSQYITLRERTLCVRAAGSASALVAALRREVGGLDPQLPVFTVKTFAEQIRESVSRERLMALLSSFSGSFALLLAALGLYGVMAYGVARRTREIGIRMALGAQASDVLWLVLGETLLLVCAGVAVGLPVAFTATRLTEGLLFGLTPNDPLMLALAVAVMVAIAAIAGYLPARRAAHIDPLRALRYE